LDAALFRGLVFLKDMSEETEEPQAKELGLGLVDGMRTHPRFAHADGNIRGE
jgi:hypothetical protein